MGNKDMPCFQNDIETIRSLKERLFPDGKIKMNETEAGKYIDSLIFQSYGNWRTNVYDKMQKVCQGIL